MPEETLKSLHCMTPLGTGSTYESDGIKITPTYLND